MDRIWVQLFLLGLGVLSVGTDAFYLPGYPPKTYRENEKVALQVNSLTSTKTQLPYDYYSVPYCKPDKRKKESENLGEVLTGDKITSSPYEIQIKENVNCRLLCPQKMSEDDMKRFRYLIDESYRVHMMVDNLPVAMRHKQFTLRGFPVGLVHEETKEHYLHNHIRFTVKYHESDKFEGARIVGFEVVPYSVKHMHGAEVLDESTPLETCKETLRMPTTPEGLQSAETADEVIFTYDVFWELDPDTTWTQRWDVYLQSSPEDEIHYFSIVNSLMITLFLTGVVAMIMLRTVKKDITSYNEMQSLEDAQEESGWKLVHGDVFRPPRFSFMLLSVLCGTGVQVLAMTLCTITFAFMGFLSPANRGGMLTALLVLFVLMGSFAGYWSACMYKFFNGKKWKRCTILTALLYPGTVFMIYWTLDLMMWSSNSSTAINLQTFLSLLALLFFVSVPLVFLGSYFGFKAQTYSIPVRVNQIARHVPQQTWYTHPAFAIALGGILPFGAVCIELFFIMSALWLHQTYYVFGFLYVVFFILVATCAEITMVMCYFQLCNEDYRWWWRAFLSAGSSAGYLLVYSVWYFYSKLEITGFISTSVYFGNMLLISITFFLLTGSCGFFACFWFVRKIYSEIKVD